MTPTKIFGDVYLPSWLETARFCLLSSFFIFFPLCIECLVSETQHRNRQLTQTSFP